MVAGVLHRHSGIGASLGQPVRVRDTGDSIMKIVIVVAAGTALLLGGCMQATLPPQWDTNFTARDRQQLANPPYRQGADPPPHSRHVRSSQPKRSASRY